MTKTKQCEYQLLCELSRDQFTVREMVRHYWMDEETKHFLGVIKEKKITTILEGKTTLKWKLQIAVVCCRHFRNILLLFV